jgi:hypothetical protein
MGPGPSTSGTGKAQWVWSWPQQNITVINGAVHQCGESERINCSLLSGTQDLSAVSCSHPDGSGCHIVFDAPRFDDGERMEYDYDIIRAIIQWPETKENINIAHERGRRLLTSSPGYKQCIIAFTGFFFFHGSSMRRMPLRHVSMFDELCSADAL